MDDSMNSAHSISAMDISPASSPKYFTMNTLPNNNLLLSAFQQQQELLANVLLSSSNVNEKKFTSSFLLSDECDNIPDRHYLHSTLLNDNNFDIKTENTQTNDLRQRISNEQNPSDNIETIPTVNKSVRQSSNKIFLVLPIFLCLIYFLMINGNKPMIDLSSSTWQNTSEYLTKNLIGQNHGLEEFKDAMMKHKNFSIVMIEGPIGCGKSYLASSIEKFFPTTLISVNTLLGLSNHHWTDSKHLTTYLLSHLTPSLFQFLIIDDLDLLKTNENYCQTLATTLHSIDNNMFNKNLFILLLHTDRMLKQCDKYFRNILTKSIQFNMLQRDHIRFCIENEASIQNVQPPLDNQQIEAILDTLKYTNENGILYSTTGCKQIPSLVMLTSRKHSNEEH